MALVLLAFLLVCGVWVKPILCGTIRLALTCYVRIHGGKLSIQRVTKAPNGGYRAEGIEWDDGGGDHRSHLTCDWMEVKPASLWARLLERADQPTALIKEMRFGKTKVLLDHRKKNRAASARFSAPSAGGFFLPAGFFPEACTGGPVDLVSIGETSRVSASGLFLNLPHRWTGGISYDAASVDLNSWHAGFPAAAAPATWDGSMLRLGELNLGNGLLLEELELSIRADRLNFGWRGSVGKGRLRGDGSLGRKDGAQNLEITAVGENLSLSNVAGLMPGNGKKTSGTIHQARFTFRGDPAKPLGGEASLRLVGDHFIWEGWNWDSVRLAGTLTGRTLTLSELRMRQQENDVVAEVRSDLPEEWRALPKAPFTATFHANLRDAGVVDVLAGPTFPQVSGGLTLEGCIKGAENKASGYCNMESAGMRIGSLPIDWMQGHLLFEGETTRLVDLEAWSGADRVFLQGQVQNGSPHAYSASARLDVQNVTKRLGQLGVATASSIGGGAIKGTWNGQGSESAHSGSFQATVTDWVSRWTKAGMTGRFQGSYTPDHIELASAEFHQDDLRLSLRLEALRDRLDVRDISATRAPGAKPLVEGGFSLPVNTSELWKSGDVVRALVSGKPLSLQLAIHGIKSEELASLLGQEIPFGGMLEGNVEVEGLMETPQIHASVNIPDFAMKGSPETKSVALNIDSEKGRWAGSFFEQPGASPTLAINADFPCQFTTENGELRISDPGAPLSAEATVHDLSADAWCTLLGGENWPLRGAALNGDLHLGGTAQHPTLAGSLRLTAREMQLPASRSLSQLVVPITCSNTVAILGEGSALYDGSLVKITGTMDWNGPQSTLELGVSGKDLPLAGFAGLRIRGDADMQLGLRGGEGSFLKGAVGIRSVSGKLQDHLTPTFSPPGLPLPENKTISAAPQPLPEILRDASLNLSITTKGMLPIDAAPKSMLAESWPERVQTDLHLLGNMSAPRLAGEIVAQNAKLILPAGDFLIPEATIRLQDTGEPSVSAWAYGITRRGICSLDLRGMQSQIHPLLFAPAGVLLPDIIFALGESVRRVAGSPVMGQALGWIRQQQVLAIPAEAWMEGALGNNDPSSLGFYGKPWCWIPGSGGTTLLNP